ncbi:hypothetical protein Syun_022939 [Stephania yunnanensis]|uniref:Uncharacterized protein n=1 Tax=Stephania yunnanensis TaxID=152371 RepID=A0AAP0FKV4_9MAGN
MKDQELELELNEAGTRLGDPRLWSTTCRDSQCKTINERSAKEDGITRGLRRMRCVMDAIPANSIEVRRCGPYTYEFPLSNLDSFPHSHSSDPNQLARIVSVRALVQISGYPKGRSAHLEEQVSEVA